MGVEQVFPPFFFFFFCKGYWPQVFFPFCYVEINLQLTFTYWCHSSLWRPQPEASTCASQHVNVSQRTAGILKSSAPSHRWAPGIGSARTHFCTEKTRQPHAYVSPSWFKIIKRGCPPVTLVGQLLMKIRIIKSTKYQISCIQFTPRPTGHKTPACPTHRELASDFICLQLDSHWTW